MLGSTVKEAFSDSRKIADVLLFDPVKEELFTVPDKTFPEELADTSLVGSSQGWGLFYEPRDGLLSISDYLNPFASKSNPKAIPLPPLPTLPYDQTQFVRNVAMSIRRLWWLSSYWAYQMVFIVEMFVCWMTSLGFDFVLCKLIWNF